ncbi:sulfurtransferase [Flexivirga endophytica]|uniref:Sulfurtransferase n=1 Tax=Flexivirga endophytica TaxID=1849103 RepID=A0A916T653_9MICO|nr:rhodanese-like domain-containing protein [Flexivirga endophytica]GGB31944.1 sulfurtransferase [Flexivirga endophytica]GHB52926.1 sulfurtransferase [Flexivirga endophytica]
MTDYTTPEQLADDAVVVDVREQNEWDAGHAPGAIHIPMGELPSRLDELPESDERDPLPIICRSGNRSGRVVAWLNQQGFDSANVEGGMKQWMYVGKPVVTDSGADAQVI